MITEWQSLLPEKKLEKKYFGILKEIVIDSKLCSHCAACAAVCPVDGISSGDQPIDFPNWTEKCVDCGACIKVCPRYDYKPLSGLGDYIEIFSGRSKRFVGQDGAMVSEITVSAIEMGLIEAAIFAGRSEDWSTKIVTIKSPEQLKNRKVTGTKYSYADVLIALKEAVLRYNSVGFVGTPCMISAVRKMQKTFKKFERVKLAIGLFCTENFYRHDLYDFLIEKKSVNLKNVVKTDIKKGKFIVTLKDGRKISFSVKELEEIVPSGCKVCQDFSAVESDVSVGSVGSEEGFSTVVVRSEAAKIVADYLKEKGYAEISQTSVDAIKKLCDYKVKIHPYPKKS
ncbi:MAG: Coenzyme F420 hydrogenase/dehydrogenase, beta subunit C-terminal domain [Archaeoglobaceae archaeon]|nr:Coenzyme F420 hydrogenase/dehydrogenase, beta subunit C-terminal domain [Archaeoglobaceae archaeon]MCX8151937.1 Coenzyme F420 hydrogenase/dehydrogenase, beta subunit C-terminal domain [Archaeoglobaceae archaeon]MDW8013326.1 Coenzyme F420 hydrogenase/dehydrogenase, beta subunit C-terminal domain [Archaeoglobaceae archaeon]